MLSRSFFVNFALSFLTWLCFTNLASAASSKSYSVGDKEHGYASWYSEGSKTASGERFDRHKLTAAHRYLPFGSIVCVTSRSTGLHVEVRINDRGPWQDGRIIDVSEAAADVLQMKRPGTIPVEIKLVHLGNGAIKKKHKDWWKFW